MTKCRKRFTGVAGLLLSLLLVLQSGMAVQASEDDSLEQLRGGVAAVLNPGSSNSVDIVNATAKELNLDLQVEELDEVQESTLVMANVRDALNVRSEADEASDKVGMLYKDCGGTILERRDGWTKLQSGNIIGWASDAYLLFGEEALALANDVGKMVATINTETLRVRTEPNMEAGVYGLLPMGEIMEVLSQDEDGWVCVDYEGSNGYVSAEYVEMDFIIDAGETMEEIRIRQEAEAAAKREAERHKNYGEYTTDADTTLLLAALIQCEAGSGSYEGMVAVGAVVMNRVRSGSYPGSISGVIYQGGQFPPALNGSVANVAASGVRSACLQAAREAINGTDNTNGALSFRSAASGYSGTVIGANVFF